jgi:hypothetical protein
LLLDTPVGVLDPKLRKELVGVFDVLDEPVVGVRAFLDGTFDTPVNEVLSEISEPGVVGTSPSAL